MLHVLTTLVRVVYRRRRHTSAARERMDLRAIGVDFEDAFPQVGESLLDHPLDTLPHGEADLAAAEEDDGDKGELGEAEAVALPPRPPGVKGPEGEEAAGAHESHDADDAEGDDALHKVPDVDHKDVAPHPRGRGDEGRGGGEHVGACVEGGVEETKVGRPAAVAEQVLWRQEKEAKLDDESTHKGGRRKGPQRQAQEGPTRQQDLCEIGPPEGVLVVALITAVEGLAVLRVIPPLIKAVNVDPLARAPALARRDELFLWRFG